MKPFSLFAACFFMIGAAFTQSLAFETMPAGKGPTEYRFISSEFVYNSGDTHNIDITSMLQRQGINQRDLKLERLKLVIDGNVTATFQTYGNNGIHALSTLNVTPKNRILFIQDTESTKNRRWQLLLSNPKNLNLKGMHVSVSR